MRTIEASTSHVLTWTSEYFITHSSETCKTRGGRMFFLFTPALQGFMWERSLPSPKRCPVLGAGRFAHMAANAYFCTVNCTYRTHYPRAWISLRSSLLCLTTQIKDEDDFQPSGFLSLSIPEFRFCMVLNRALNLLKTILTATICSFSCLPWLFLLSLTAHLCVWSRLMLELKVRQVSDWGWRGVLDRVSISPGYSFP